MSGDGPLINRVIAHMPKNMSTMKVTNFLKKDGS